MNDPTHYVPAWSYNPQDGRGFKKPVTQQEAMAELVEAVNTLKPDNFTPKIITQSDDYLYVEYESPTFGFIDDVEFWFPADKCAFLKLLCLSQVSSCFVPNLCLNVSQLTLCFEVEACAVNVVSHFQ
jgi:hypothetical protein